MSRPPEIGVARSQVTCVRWSEPEIAEMDRARGGMDRSEYIRQAVAAQNRRAGGDD